MCCRNNIWIIFWCSIYNNLRNEIALAKNLVTEFSYILCLIVINRDKYHSIIFQQPSSKTQSWIHH